MRMIFQVFFTLFFLISQERVTVAVSSNMQYAFEELKTVFEKEKSIHVRPIFSSSGKLTAQIMSGAPFDVFLSADMFYPDTLFKSGLTLNSPQIYAYGSLILWSSKKNISDVNQLNKAEKIAIADPNLAPYGKESEKVLKKYTYQTKSNIVFGQNIGQVNNYIITGVVDLGLTSKSVVMNKRFKTLGSWLDVPKSDYDPIEQGVVIINRDQTNMNDIKAFYSFLFSDRGKQILKKYGYFIDQVKGLE